MRPRPRRAVRVAGVTTGPRTTSFAHLSDGEVGAVTGSTVLVPAKRRPRLGRRHVRRLHRPFLVISRSTGRAGNVHVVVRWSPSIPYPVKSRSAPAGPAPPQTRAGDWPPRRHTHRRPTGQNFFPPGHVEQVGHVMVVRRSPRRARAPPHSLQLATGSEGSCGMMAPPAKARPNPLPRNRTRVTAERDDNRMRRPVAEGPGVRRWA